MSETSDIVTPIRLELSRGDARLFRNNNGTLQDRHGNYVTYGLGPGTSDLIGWRSMVVTQEMVGTRIALFAAVECKTMTGRTARKRMEQQRAFVQLVREHGGLAGFAHSVDEARRILSEVRL